MKWPFRRKKKQSSGTVNVTANQYTADDARMSVRPQEFRAGRNPRPNDRFIAVMGVTGSGKSSFIEMLTGANVEIGAGLEACTSKIDVYPYELGPNETVYLIDTPGFNDTYTSDAKILLEITTWLATSYKNKIHLNGVVYLHDITQGRMYGSSLSTLKAFKELSGEDAMKRVILTTTHWDIVHPGSRAQTEANERQLIETKRFWGSMIEQGSRVERHDNTKASAERLIRLIVGPSQITLAVQAQMVDQRLKLSETNAGRALGMDLMKKMQDNHRQQLEELRVDKKRSDEMQRKAQREHQRELAKLEVTTRELAERMNREIEAREERLRKQVEEHARREEELRREQAEAYARREGALRRERESLERQRRQWLEASESDKEEEEDEESEEDSDNSDDSDDSENEEYSHNPAGNYYNYENNVSHYAPTYEPSPSSSSSSFSSDVNAHVGFNNWNSGAYNSVSVHNGSSGVWVDNNIIGAQMTGNEGVFNITNTYDVYSGDSHLVVNGRRIPYNGGSVSVINENVWINGRAV
ncbi:P-loop containing nucleoside triphosphate hydrolase protein [Aspergillus cavernicola]|uniref:P-loop containing nucleoside triphosphate hydrolase protein n=1 Tax=Aspergillus cavernicola TaxID=176166 RepID=A0ABR4HF87_9EURO